MCVCARVHFTVMLVLDSDVHGLILLLLHVSLFVLRC